MKKELTIEHLATYLPYGIPASLSREGEFNLDAEYPNPFKGKLGLVNSISFEKGEVSYGVLSINDKVSFDFEGLSEIDVYLRPISDLTSEITHNGETFVPNERMLSDLSVDRESIHYLMKMFEVGIGYQVEWQIIQKLHSWHFDTFGLIEAGLAIDINTINK
jgi:hypothetical protein